MSEITVLQGSCEEAGRLRVHLRKPLLLSFLASGGIQGLNAVTGIVLARELGASARGQLAAVLLWPSLLAGIGSLGVVDAVTFYVARGRRVGVVVGTALLLGAIQSVMLIGIGLPLLPILLGRLGAEAVRTAQAFLAVFVPLNILTLTFLAAFNGLQAFRRFQTLRAAVVGLLAIGFVGLAAAHALSVAWAAGMYAIANILVLAAAAALYVRVEGARLALRASVAKELVGYGLKSHLGNVSGQLNQRLDQLVISVFLAPVQLGIYVVAVTITSLTALIGPTIGIVALPIVARAETPEEQARLARILVGLTVAGAIVVTIPFLLVTPELLRVFFGRSYLGAATPARILLVGAVVMTTNATLGALLRAAGRPLSAGVGESAALVVTCAALGTLLPAFGLIGAAVASVLAYGTSGIYLVARARRAFGVSTICLFVPRRKDLHPSLEAP